MTEVHSESGLYAEHRASLVRYASWLVPSDDAADAVSDAMKSLLKSGTLANAENPQALMHRAVLAKTKSMQRSFFRRRAREQRFAERWIQEDPRFRPDVVAAVVRLSPQQRAQSVPATTSCCEASKHPATITANARRMSVILIHIMLDRPPPHRSLLTQRGFVMGGDSRGLPWLCSSSERT